MSSSISVEVFDSLHELLGLFRLRMRKAMEAVRPDLTFNEMRILMRTGRQPGITQKALVEHARTDKAQMARTLAHLQKEGWLKRSTSESDRRIRCLHLSAQGRELFAQLRDEQERISAEILQDCSPAVQAQLLDLLRQARDSACAADAGTTAASREPALVR